MKPDIHPEYFENAVIACACGAQYKTGSTQERIDIELCAACHPFFTGKQKIVDTARRVEKFTDRSTGKAAAPRKTNKDKNAEKQARAKVKAEKKASRDTSIKTAR